MKSWVLAAGLLAAAAVPAAWAADVEGDGPPPPKSGPYGVYKAPKAPPPGGPPTPFNYDDDEDEGPGGPPPPGRKYSEPPPPPGKKYSEVPPPYGQKCVRSEQVREQLTSLGWSDFHGGQKQGDLVTLRARRPSGRLFELTLHRCSGQLVDAAPLEPRRFGPYAFKAPYEQPYAYDGPPRRPYYYRQYEYDGPYEGPYRRWYRYRY